MIGVIGYGMVGKAVAKGFSKTTVLISDPKYNDLSVEYMCSKNPKAIFVCVPTPTDETNYSLLKEILKKILSTGYTGLTVVKSTVLPHHLEEFDVLYNPEFLSRATAYEDFVNPPLVIIGGNRAKELWEVYKLYSDVKTEHVCFTDIKTASLAKYTFNTFYATKVTFMNQIFDVANKMGVDYNKLIQIIGLHPWVGTSHLNVPGHDGRGFSGPCLPKDTEALAKEFNLELLTAVLSINAQYRDQ